MILDQTQVLAALGAIAKAAPDLPPTYHCTGLEVDYEVAAWADAERITPLLSKRREVRATPLYDGGWAGIVTTSTGPVPVRVLVGVPRWKRAAA